MTDKKTSALTSSTTPLAGTEVLPIVQSGSTVKVAVANLTAGRAVDALSLNIGTGTAIAGTRITAGNNTGAPSAWGLVSIENCGGISPPSSAGFNLGWNYSNGGGETNVVYGISVGGAPALSFASYNGVTLTEVLRLDNGNNIKFVIGNLIQGTAAKGINFTANTPAAGMTSQLLNWYEEGTWTPNQGAGLTVVGGLTATGTYTRIGRLVTVTAKYVAGTSLTIGAAGVVSTNLPFTALTESVGSITTNDVSVNGSVVIGGSGTTVYNAATITAKAQMFFTLTYPI